MRGLARKVKVKSRARSLGFPRPAHSDRAETAPQKQRARLHRIRRIGYIDFSPAANAEENSVVVRLCCTVGRAVSNCEQLCMTNERFCFFEQDRGHVLHTSYDRFIFDK